MDISENRLEDIPIEIYGLSKLTDLHLSQNSIEYLPDSIGDLSRLTIFKIDQNRLSELNRNIGRCCNLQELVLTENLISELPPTMGNLLRLSNLNVDRNRLEYLPPQIGNLGQLGEPFNPLHKNQCLQFIMKYAILFSNIMQIFLPIIGVLSLRENQLTWLPREIGTCSELHVLDVSGNRLQHLPFTLTNLNLKALWLAENQAKPMLNFQTDYDEQTGEQVNNLDILT